MRTQDSGFADHPSSFLVEDLPEGAPLEFVRISQGCAELGCSPATFWRRVKAGDIHKPVKIGPNTSVLLRHRLEADKRRILARAEAAA